MNFREVAIPTQLATLNLFMRKHAFTLIELLVVISIILMISGLGLANFVRYKEKKQVESAARKVYELAVSAKTRAQNKQAPASGVCDATNPISAYHFRINTALDPDKVSVTPVCGSDEYDVVSSDDEFTLDSNLQVSSDASVYFYPLGKTPTSDGGWPVSIQVSDGKVTYGFTIDQGGNISQVEKI